VEGYPFEKNFSETDNYYEKIISVERNLKYLDILAENQEDVLDLYFISKTFKDKIDLKKHLSWENENKSISDT
jgi:pyruvate formate-lyase activating enzyme-like uncharacterized protein